jgi:sensor histidine kinase YesM
MKFVRLYLELQQKRFADRLTLSLPDNDSLPSTWVPSLILQPLIENAVVHGLAGNKAPVSIRVETKLDADVLVLRVLNSHGPQSNGEHHGIGLRNVTERLAVHFQDRAVLTAGPLTDMEWCAEIRMPILGDGPQNFSEH